jgi:hypothetical protein
MIVVVYYALQLSEVQSALAQKATKWLGDKLGSEVTVGSARISWLDEITLEDINIKDLKGRDMIFVRELYVNCKTNFTFNAETYIEFDNNLDYVLLKNPEVKLVKENNGHLNIDDWIAQIERMTSDSTKKVVGDHNTAFTIDNAYIKNGFVSLTDSRKKRSPENLFDYNNFRFDQINANLEKVLILGDTVAFRATTINGIDKRSQLDIKNIKTDFLYCKTAMTLDKLSAYINNSFVSDKLHFYYDRPSAFDDFFHKIRMRADLKNSVFDSQDLGRFAPEMYAINERYELNASMKGRYVDLTFDNFDLKFGKSSYLKGDVNFKGFPDLKKTVTDLKLKPSLLVANDLKQYSKNADYQKYITKVEQLNLSGTYKGVYDDFVMKADLQSKNLGKVNGLINVKIGNGADAVNYFGNIDATKFELGKFIDDPEALQTISFKGEIKGDGFKLIGSTIELDGEVASIGFNGYDYKNIVVDGKLGKSVFDGFVDIKDPNLTADVSGRVDFNKELNSFKIVGNLGNANLQNLGITKDPMQIKSTINFDFVGNKLDDWIGRAQFKNTEFTNQDGKLRIDSLFFNSAIAENQRRFSVVSEFWNLYLNGEFTPSQIINDLKLLGKEYRLYFEESEQQRNEYYALKKKNYVSTLPYEAYYKLFFKNSRTFFDFFAPDYYVSSGSSLSGKFSNKTTSEFTLAGTLDTLNYKKSAFYANHIDFNSSKKILAPEVLTALVVSSENQNLSKDIETQDLVFNAYWGLTNTIDFDLGIKQKSTSSFGNMTGKVSFLEKGYEIKFSPENSGMFLVKDEWKIDPENAIYVENKEISVRNLEFSNKSQRVSLNGVIANDDHEESILTVENLNLQTLKPFTNSEIKGIANGELRLKNFYDDPLITSTLHIDELIYQNSLIGTVNTEAVWDNIDEKLNINGNIYRVNKEIFRVNGSFDPKNKLSPLALKAKLRNLNIDMFEGILKGTFSKLGGFAEGDVLITGFPLDPIFKGEVKIDKGTLKIDASGTTLYFDDRIICSEEGFVAPSEGITVKDALVGGNTAQIQGGIYNGGSGNFMVGLHGYIKGKDGFKIMQISSNENATFSGIAYTTGDIHLSGDFSNLNINANLTSKKGTKIVIPLDNEKKIDTKQEGIPFIGKIKNPEVISAVDVPKKKVKTDGVKMAFNLSFTPDAECEIIFDRTNNDILDVFGEGRLSIVYDTRGEFSINGPYVVKSGKYNFSFQNLASLRKFNIIDGSRITWSGDPYEAVLDMKAAYTANIPISKITNRTEDANIRYPVNVMVLLTERLMTPTIKYDIAFDMKQVPFAVQQDLLGFEQKLRNDEQLLSRNVSSILVFNEIFPDNFADALTQQFLIDNVSNLLSNQIGNLANKLNPNLELGVQFGDIRTNLLNNMQLNFSYRFSNNRIKLTGKSSFINAIENSINANTQGQLSVGGELEYLLSPDGEYKFKLYSRSVPTNYYLISTGGNVVVSGGNLIISRNFNSLFGDKKNKSIPLGVGTAKKEEREVSMKDLQK